MGDWWPENDGFDVTRTLHVILYHKIPFEWPYIAQIDPFVFALSSRSRWIKTRLSVEIRHTYEHVQSSDICCGFRLANIEITVIAIATMGVGWKSVQFSDLHVRSCVVSLKTIVRSGTWSSSGVRWGLGVSKTNPLLTLSSRR